MTSKQEDKRATSVFLLVFHKIPPLRLKLQLTWNPSSFEGSIFDDTEASDD